MEQVNHHTKINASENAVIWSQYVNDSLSRCILRYMLHDVKDEDIRDLLEFALELSETHLEKTKQILSLENLPIPIGFTDEDVTVDAPSLFTDTFKIVYLHIITIRGLTRYAGATSVCIREDVRKYFIECTSQISGMHLNMQKTMVKMVLELGFSQVCQSKEERDYMERASKLCIKHFDILSSRLKEENLHVPKLF